jgi:aryl-alcohol dehydrogenase-like predicted oxidoreductase
VRYTGVSNFSGWHVMKSLATSERMHLNKHVAYQGYYSLIAREYEHELMPLCLDQGLGTMVWSPLGWGRLTGKIRRGQPVQAGRIASGGDVGGPEVDQEYLYTVVDALALVAEQCQRSIAQVALAWLLTRPSVANLVIGARDEKQLQENLSVLQLKLSTEQIAILDGASQRTPVYPYWHQRFFDERNPKPTTW